tara:strand:- start:222 stop:2279 length:2058 start_codon:yes stop_codon:yes gene_type:complete
MTRILIEDFDLDIDKGLSNQITYAVSDLKNIDSKSTSFSKTIVLPGTANNNSLLGNIFEFNNANFTNDAALNVGYNYNASKTAKCSIQVNGMTVIKGVFKLLEIIIDGQNVEYECSVIGELGGFSMKLGAKKLEELDFSAYNHTYNVTNISASWDNWNAGSGYYYPHIDYGLYSTAKHDWQFGTFRPALFAKEYLEKIFTSAGYTYEIGWAGTPESDRFKSLIIPHNQKKLIKSGSALVFATPINTAYYLEGNTNIVYENFSGTNWTLVAGNQFKYTGVDTIQTDISVFLNFNCVTTESGGNNGMWVEVWKNGTLISGSRTDYDGWSGSEYFYYSYFGSAISVSTNDYFQVIAHSVDDGFDYDTMQGQNGTFNVGSLIPTILDVNYNDTVTLNDTIPKNILQKDFFASMLKLFNLYVDENRFDEKHLIIKPYNNYYDGSVEDWSDKVDMSKPIRVKPMSELNSRYYSFKFKDDSDYWNDLYKKRYNEGYGSRIYDSEYEFSKETESVELIFSPTVIVGVTGEEKIYSTIYKFTNGVEERIDSNIRIMLAKKSTGVISWNILNGATVLLTTTSYGYAGHLNDPDIVTSDLNFGVPRELFFILDSGALNVNQFNVYYSPYMAEITDKDSRLLTCNVKLTDTDIFNLSFSSFKYIDGGLYRLTKLMDYTPEANETTKAEFLRVINKEY